MRSLSAKIDRSLMISNGFKFGWVSCFGAALFIAWQLGGTSAWAQGTEGNAHGAHSSDFMSLLFVLLLATFVGLGVITRVSRLLHTPLMSLTNAISAIAVVGAIVIAGSPKQPFLITFMGVVALFASMTNIVSGFLITDRMLKMFKQPEQNKS